MAVINEQWNHLSITENVRAPQYPKLSSRPDSTVTTTLLVQDSRSYHV